uniref:Ig-like domain-containing protein n=1 Tax=Pseudonaja textilis TaxID=8673 RepID=A0A670ZDN1_PSETE
MNAIACPKRKPHSQLQLLLNVGSKGECWFASEDQGCTSQSDSVSQKQNHMEIIEGENATLPCNFTTITTTPYIFWYRQYENQIPERILSADKFSSEDKEVSLIDEAVYFCPNFSSLQS